MKEDLRKVDYLYTVGQNVYGPFDGTVAEITAFWKAHRNEIDFLRCIIFDKGEARLWGWTQKHGWRPSENASITNDTVRNLMGKCGMKLCFGDYKF